MKFKGLGAALSGALMLAAAGPAFADDGPSCTVYPCKPATICRAGDSICYDQKLREARLAVGNKKILTARDLLKEIRADKKSIMSFVKDDTQIQFEQQLTWADASLEAGEYEAAKRHLAFADDLLKKQREKLKESLSSYLMNIQYADVNPECPKGALCESKKRKPAYAPVAAGSKLGEDQEKNTSLSAE